MESTPTKIYLHLIDLRYKVCSIILKRILFLKKTLLNRCFLTLKNILNFLKNSENLQIKTKEYL